MALKKKGIRRVDGRICYNVSIFDEQPLHDSWQWGDIGNYYAAGVSGLNFHENMYFVYFNAGKKLGYPATAVRTVPKNIDIHGTCEVTTAGENTGDQVTIYGSPTGKERLYRGTVPLGKTDFAVRGAMPNPARTCADLFSSYLRTHGIGVSSNSMQVYSTPDSLWQVVDYRSTPYYTIAQYTNLTSNNTKVSTDDLRLMFAAANPQGRGRLFFNNYDQRGDAKVRLAAELGFELSTKFHNTWQDIRSEFFQIDGLRHIAQPYINYTFIPKPTLSRDKILFFDDIDRITKQNFFRFGIINRLQTRDGGGVSDLLYMESYWDIHLEKAEGMSAFGNIGTIISAKLFKGLSLNTEFLIDISGDGKIADTIRHGRNAGRTGLAQKWLNMWDINLTYTPAPNWKFTVGYNYVRPYDMRSAYSMGSTLTQINSASYFLQYNNRTDEDFYLRASLPLTPDHRTFGSFLFTYDVQEGSIDKVGMAVLRKFHCWELILTLGFDRNYNITKHKWKWDFEYSVSANFTGLSDSMNTVQNTVLQRMDNTITNLNNMSNIFSLNIIFIRFNLFFDKSSNFR